MLRWQRWKWRVEYALAWPVLRLAQSIPDAWVGPFTYLVGSLAYLMAFKERRWGLRNLQLVFGENLNSKQRRQLVSTSFVNLSRTICEILRMGRSWILQNTIVEGERNVERLMEDLKTRPVIVAGGHLGNWEILVGYWRSRGIPCALVSRPLDNPYLESELARARDRYGSVAVNRRGCSMRDGIRRLRQREALGLAVDQNYSKGGIFVDYLGIPAATPKGAAQLALQENARIYLVTTHRRSDGKHVITVDPPISFEQTSNREHDIKRLTQQIVRRFERCVLTHPEQYHWLHHRWCCRPDGSDWTLSTPMDEMLAERTRPHLRLSLGSASTGRVRRWSVA